MKKKIENWLKFKHGLERAIPDEMTGKYNFDESDIDEIVNCVNEKSKRIKQKNLQKEARKSSASTPGLSSSALANLSKLQQDRNANNVSVAEHLSSSSSNQPVFPNIPTEQNSFMKLPMKNMKPQFSGRSADDTSTSSQYRSMPLPVFTGSSSVYPSALKGGGSGTNGTNDVEDTSRILSDMSALSKHDHDGE